MLRREPCAQQARAFTWARLSLVAVMLLSVIAIALWLRREGSDEPASLGDNAAAGRSVLAPPQSAPSDTNLAEAGVSVQREPAGLPAQSPSVSGVVQVVDPAGAPVRGVRAFDVVASVVPVTQQRERQSPDGRFDAGVTPGSTHIVFYHADHAVKRVAAAAVQESAVVVMERRVRVSCQIDGLTPEQIAHHDFQVSLAIGLDSWLYPIARACRRDLLRSYPWTAQQPLEVELPCLEPVGIEVVARGPQNGRDQVVGQAKALIQNPAESQLVMVSFRPPLPVGYGDCKASFLVPFPETREVEVTVSGPVIPGIGLRQGVVVSRTATGFTNQPIDSELADMPFGEYQCRATVSGRGTFPLPAFVIPSGPHLQIRGRTDFVRAWVTVAKPPPRQGSKGQVDLRVVDEGLSTVAGAVLNATDGVGAMTTSLILPRGCRVFAWARDWPSNVVTSFVQLPTDVDELTTQVDAWSMGQDVRFRLDELGSGLDMRWLELRDSRSGIAIRTAASAGTVFGPLTLPSGSYTATATWLGGSGRDVRFVVPAADGWVVVPL